MKETYEQAGQIQQEAARRAVEAEVSTSSPARQGDPGPARPLRRSGQGLRRPAGDNDELSPSRVRSTQKTGSRTWVPSLVKSISHQDQRRRRRRHHHCDTCHQHGALVKGGLLTLCRGREPTCALGSGINRLPTPSVTLLAA